jgi:hypothetical protein
MLNLSLPVISMLPNYTSCQASLTQHQGLRPANTRTVSWNIQGSREKVKQFLSRGQTKADDTPYRVDRHAGKLQSL